MSNQDLSTVIRIARRLAVLAPGLLNSNSSSEAEAAELAEELAKMGEKRLSALTATTPSALADRLLTMADSDMVPMENAMNLLREAAAALTSPQADKARGEAAKLPAKWRAEADTCTNTCSNEDRGYNNAQYQLADELEAALTTPQPQGDASRDGWECRCGDWNHPDETCGQCGMSATPQVSGGGEVLRALMALRYEAVMTKERAVLVSVDSFDQIIAALSTLQPRPVEKHFLLTDYQINEASQQRKDGKWLTLERTVYAEQARPDGGDADMQMPGDVWRNSDGSPTYIDPAPTSDTSGGELEWVRQKRDLLSARMVAGGFHAQDALDMTMLSRLLRMSTPQARPSNKELDIERRWVEAGRIGTAKTRTVYDLMEEILFMAEPAPTADGGAVPSGVWEALQRMIEDGMAKGAASQEDAQLVAEWRRRFLHPAPAPDVARLESALKEAESRVIALEEGIEKALEEIEDAGPKALKYAAQELHAAMNQGATNGQE